MWWCWNVIFARKKLLRNFSNNTFHENLRGLYLHVFAEIVGLWVVVFSPSLRSLRIPLEVAGVRGTLSTYPMNLLLDSLRTYWFQGYDGYDLGGFPNQLGRQFPLPRPSTKKEKMIAVAPDPKYSQEHHCLFGSAAKANDSHCKSSSLTNHRCLILRLDIRLGTQVMMIDLASYYKMGPFCRFFINQVISPKING